MMLCLVGGVNNTLHILLQNTLSSYIIYLFIGILLLLLTTTIYNKKVDTFERTDCNTRGRVEVVPFSLRS